MMKYRLDLFGTTHSKCSCGPMVRMDRRG